MKQIVPSNNTRQRDGLLNGIDKNATPEKNTTPGAGSGANVQPYPQGRTYVVNVVNGDDVVRVEYTLDEDGRVLASRKLPTRAAAIFDAVPQFAPVNNVNKQGLRNAIEQKAQPAAPAAGPVDPKQTLTLNVHVADYQAWPAIDAKIKALVDSPNLQCKSWRSGEYMWVTLSPVNVDPGTFARKINFGRIVAVHTDQRLIYVESGR